VGGLANSLALWGLGYLGAMAKLGISLRPPFTPTWLYPRLVWGGLWGLLFLVPLLRGRTILRGVLLSLAPSTYALLVVLPDAGQGRFGLSLGVLTPGLVVLVNILWGIVAAAWYRFSTR